MIEDETAVEPGLSYLLPTGLSGDPLLKRLVELANLGWRAKLIILTNGVVIEGLLISPADFRTVLADSIRNGGDEDRAYLHLREMVADAITADDPDPMPLGRPTDVPEPRFIHLADVTIGSGVRLPFLRLRLPAVSGFWVVAEKPSPGHADTG
jgi:hypothetical protein